MGDGERASDRGGLNLGDCFAYEVAKEHGCRLLYILRIFQSNRYRERSLKRNRLFRDHYNIPLVHADASELFLKALDGVTHPETKRKTIGALFIDVFEAEAKKSMLAGRSSWPRARSIPT